MASKVGETRNRPIAGTRTRPIAGIGRIVGWAGGSLWIGRHLMPIEEHAHHAIQISLALTGSFRVQASGWPAARETRGMVALPDQPHRFDGCGAEIATLFVEPNSTRGAALRQRFADKDVALLSDEESHRAVQFLHTQYTAAASDEVLGQFAQGAACTIAGNPAAAPSEDPRIVAALAWMNRRLARTIRLQDVAAAVHLSPSHFRHLFVAQTGTSLRAWLLWARVDQAMASAFRDGQSWTEAAHANGFSDAAHLTRTCRQMFGLAPTMLVPEDAQKH